VLLLALTEAGSKSQLVQKLAPIFLMQLVHLDKRTKGRLSLGRITAVPKSLQNCFPLLRDSILAQGNVTFGVREPLKQYCSVHGRQTFKSQNSSRRLRVVAEALELTRWRSPPMG
jgi:hypothetical protein